MSNKKIRLDFIVVVGWVLLSIPLILFFKVRFLTSTIIFFAVPSIYLLVCKPKQLKKLLFVLIPGMVFSFSIDFLAELNGAWSWAPHGQLVFENKFFGLIPLDVLIWYFFWILLTIIYYEHFLSMKILRKYLKIFGMLFVLDFCF